MKLYSNEDAVSYHLSVISCYLPAVSHDSFFTCSFAAITPQRIDKIPSANKFRDFFGARYQLFLRKIIPKRSHLKRRMKLRSKKQTFDVPIVKKQSKDPKMFS